VTSAFARVPELLAQHLLLAFSALLLGLVVSLPLAILSSRNRTVGRVALAFASLVQTIPSLALLALFYPVLLWLSALVGGGIPALGFLPSLLALSLYALLPILRNGVTGLAGLDPAALEAADAIGMTRNQRLWLVEAPLVAPVLMAGIRTAAVWTIGAATLSTTVGQPSLGDLIFAGLQTQNWTLVLAGCVAAGHAGAKGFSEQYILARLIGHRLEKAGYEVRYREGLGSGVAFGALAAGDVDVYVEYSGTLWTNQMQRSDVPPRRAIVDGVAQWAKATRGVTLLGPLGFENAYAFAMRGDDAKRRRIASLSDLASQAGELDFATDVEFLERPEWAAVRRAYGLSFKSARPYQPTFMYRALGSGEADVIPAFSSDGRIAADRLAVLTDPKGAIPGYDAILLLAPKRSGDARFHAALRPLIGAIPVEKMREANYLVDRDADKKSPDQAALWLERGLGR
jgi:osmoprotectant transport system permease protein